MTRRGALAGLGAAACSLGGDFPAYYSFRVFGLLAPRTLVVTAAGPGRGLFTKGSSTVEVQAGEAVTVPFSAAPVSLAGPDGFVLEIPGVIRRRFRGRLWIWRDGEVLAPVVEMDEETAVSSIVGAELPASHTPGEALAAQAVVVRSFLRAAGRRHRGFDFCDTTHCQFLRAPAPEGSPVAVSVKQTRGKILWSDGAIVAAFYSAACGGRTDAAKRFGYHYRSVACEVCQTERTVRRGHGLGLCQIGAIGWAKKGWPPERILAKYFPATYVADES